MCLTNLKSRKEVAAFKRKQPKEFTVWKVVNRDGGPEYQSSSGEPVLDVPGKIYRAKYFLGTTRIRLTYKAGFHAFRTKRQAQRYLNRSMMGSYLKKFKAKRAWITNIGKALNITCLVLSHIKVLGD